MWVGNCTSRNGFRLKFCLNDGCLLLALMHRAQNDDNDNDQKRHRRLPKLFHSVRIDTLTTLSPANDNRQPHFKIFQLNSPLSLNVRVSFSIHTELHSRRAPSTRVNCRASPFAFRWRNLITRMNLIFVVLHFVGNVHGNMVSSHDIYSPCCVQTNDVNDSLLLSLFSALQLLMKIPCALRTIYSHSQSQPLYIHPVWVHCEACRSL